jgi:signal transduction histidine kinase
MWRVASVRVRVAIATVVVVGIALAFGGFTLVRLQQRALTTDLENTARTRVRDIAQTVADGSLTREIVVPRGENNLAQVVDGSGRIVAASKNLSDDPRLSRLVPSSAKTEATTVRDYPEAAHPLRVVARRVQAGGQRYIVYVASSLGPVSRSTDSLERLLLIGLPFLALLAGLLAWIAVSLALRPVEAMRQEVEAIGAEGLHRRVPDPPVEDEIGRLAHTMNAMLARLEVATDRQRRFVADASHELRSPLTGIRTELEVNLAHPEQVDWATVGHEILDDTIRLQHLVDDLLVLAAADASPEDASRHHPVDLDEVVLAEARRVRNRTGTTIETSSVSGAQVDGNAEQLGRVVRNLLDNAVRYAESRVVVTLTEMDGRAVLTIADDGPGVPADERERIFERFARHDSGRSRSAGGTGLGLAISREIVTDHHGTIVLEPGPGTQFTVRLPIASVVG